MVSNNIWCHPIKQDKDDKVYIPTSISCQNLNAPSIDFELGMNHVYKYGKVGNEAVVYKGSSADELVYKIRRKDGNKVMGYDSNLRLLDQLDL